MCQALQGQSEGSLRLYKVNVKGVSTLRSQCEGCGRLYKVKVKGVSGSTRSEWRVCQTIKVKGLSVKGVSCSKRPE